MNLMVHEFLFFYYYLKEIVIVRGWRTRSQDPDQLSGFGKRTDNESKLRFF